MTRYADARPYTAAEIKKALDLEAQGVSRRAIAERLGRTYNSLGATLSKHKRIPKTFTMEEFARRADRMATLFEKGVTIAELAKIFDTSETAVCNLLTRMGLDAEARREIRVGLTNA